MSLKRIGIPNVSIAISTLEDIIHFYDNNEDSFDTLPANERIARFNDLIQYATNAQATITDFTNKIEDQILILQGLPAPSAGGRRSRVRKTRKYRK